MSQAGLRAAHEETMKVLRSGADVIFQATFFDGKFLGFADFLGPRPGWHLGRFGIPSLHAMLGSVPCSRSRPTQTKCWPKAYSVSSSATLVLGDGTHSVHRVDEVLPVFRAQRERFLKMVRNHLARRSAGPVEFRCPALMRSLRFLRRAIPGDP